ncbi:MAG TPA: hypothetical protein VNI34_10465 [Candidatus Nitrosotalea sp.]|nr:hypothetical protein [Candidatus Nitrosotalea sp.]
MSAEAWEAVPNFSTARPERVAELARRAGTALLDVHADQGHGRSVVTLASTSLNKLCERLFALIEYAVEYLDLSAEGGVHPRVGVADVVPLVALKGDPAAGVEAAHGLGHRLNQELGLPIYFYALASPGASPTSLADVRHGRVPPDLPGRGAPPGAGASCLGVRPPLVAYNVSSPALDPALARAAVLSLRRLPGVQALALGDQVSMNLTRPDLVGMGLARSTVNSIVPGPLIEELVGLCPASAAVSPAADGALLESRLAAHAGRNLAPTLGAANPDLAGALEEWAITLERTGASPLAMIEAAERVAWLTSRALDLGSGGCNWMGGLEFALSGLLDAVQKFGDPTLGPRLARLRGAG